MKLILTSFLRVFVPSWQKWISPLKVQGLFNRGADPCSNTLIDYAVDPHKKSGEALEIFPL